MRGKEPIIAIRDPGRYKSNAFAKHVVEHHPGRNDVKFKMDIVKCYRKPLERQVREGVEILRANADCIMNSKLDFIQPRLRRMTFEDILQD